MSDYDLVLFRRYLHNALQRAQGLKSLRSAVIGWLWDNSDEFDEWGTAFLRDGYELERAASGYVARGYARRAIAALARSVEGPPLRNAGSRATAHAARAFGLDQDCAALLELTRLYGADSTPVENLWDTLSNRANIDRKAVTAVFLAMSRRRVEKALRQLVRMGIAGDVWHSHVNPGCYTNGWFDTALYRPPVSGAGELAARIVPRAAAPRLGMDDFAHLEETADVSGLLAGAVRSGEAVRILLHGRPGTGKTEFAKTLSAAVGARLHDLGSPPKTADWKWEPDYETRRKRLRMAQALLRAQPNAVLLCDEVEDVLSSDAGDRLLSHQLLDECAVPVLFTGNSLKEFDEALLRRFDLTIRFKAHNPTRRRSVVRRMLRASDLPWCHGTEADALAVRLADDLECPPAIIEQAIRSTRLTGGSSADLFRFAERQERTISTHIQRPRLGPPVKPSLPWEAFSHLGQPAEDFHKLLLAAVRARRAGESGGTGLTFLAYGPPGCGKTEFCRTVGAEAGATVYSIGDQEVGLDPRLPAGRSDALKYAIEALADEPGAVIVFDELEDFWGQEPKHWMNRLVECTPVPILFTANAIGVLRTAPYFLERVTYSREMLQLPRSRRTKMFGELLPEGRNALAEELASDAQATPRQAKNAAHVARVTEGGAPAASRALAQKRSLLRGSGAAPRRRPDLYDPSLVRADRDLVALAERIVAMGPARVGLLLDGVPGSGKSEYARHLADRLDLECVVKRASDLMSKWVGETEQQIAGAFEEARATKGFLVIDEADSFLADRRGASRNWEISEVNEMLSQLESHDLPYAFTTNLARRLDPAAARRFLFKVTFRYLDRDRIRRCWKLFFGGECPPDVERLTRVVPADFALARERARVLGVIDDPLRCAEELRAEVRAKRGARATLGFHDAAPQPPDRPRNPRPRQP